MRSHRSLSLAAAIFASLTGGSLAADMAMPSYAPAPAAQEQQVEWGSGWYLRGDIGLSKDSQPPINTNLSYTSTSKSKSLTQGSIGFGLKANDWMRFDATLDMNNQLKTTASQGGLACQVGAAPIKNGAGTVVGSTPVMTTCYGNQTAVLNRATAMINGYFDLGTWSGLTPYLGAGIGLTHTTASGKTKYYYTGNNLPYNPTWTDPFDGGTYNLNWDTTYGPKAHTNLVWGVMGGVAVDVSDHAKLDIGVKYINLGQATAIDSVTGALIKKTIISKQLRVGMRYMID